MIPVAKKPRLGMKPPFGLDSVTATVRSSVASAPANSTGINADRAMPLSGSPRPSTFRLRATTSAVSGVPSENVTPSRIVSV